MPDKSPKIFLIMHSTGNGVFRGSSEPIGWAFDYETCDEWIKSQYATHPMAPGAVRYYRYHIVEVSHIDAQTD